MAPRTFPAGTNLFQQIKAVSADAEARGKKLLRLSIGQPSGPALASARKIAATLILSGEQKMHEYQDNGCLPLPDFARRFVQAHTKRDVARLGLNVADFLPIPGIKPMLPIVIVATLKGIAPPLDVYTTTKPGYPTPADWCEYLDTAVEATALLLNPSNGFRFSPTDVQPKSKKYTPTLVMMNYPHNPSGQVANRDWLIGVCEWCAKNKIRLFNDAAYSILAHTDEHCTLADVAVDFSTLSWAEAFSASKAGNFTGWRVGAMIGSPDFIEDIRTVKGNTDSGFVAPLAIGALHAFERDRDSIKAVRHKYQERLKILIEILTARGMRLAVKPQAGFFSLWLTPRRAFGQDIGSADEFNFLMIEKTGVVGVHFDPYVRYAVCNDVEAMAEGIDQAFAEANVSY